MSVTSGFSLRSIVISRKVIGQFSDILGRCVSMMGSVEASIHSKLKEHFKPLYLDVMNESNMHNVPKGSETHFKVVLVSDLFNSKTLIQRHRMINQLLVEELNGPVHALSIQAKTPQQWEDSKLITKSPPCLGGSGK